MKKTVFLVTSLNSGGIENYLLRFLTYFEKEIEPIVICKGNTFGDLESSYRKIKNIQLIKMNIGYFDLQSNYKFYKLIRQYKCYSLCDFTGNFSGLILLISKFARVKKRIAFYRGSTNHFNESKSRLIYNKVMLVLVKQNATKILSNSHAALDFFFSERVKDDKRFEVIYNGIDSKKFCMSSKNIKKEDFGIQKNGFVIGHTGRFNSAKNHSVIIEVAKEMCRKYDNIYFVLCGKNTDTSLSDVVLSDSFLRAKLKILGYRKDIYNILPIFDLYFFPSITEGQPNSLIEAMIFGLPIVASNIEPIKETTPKVLHNELIDPLNVKVFCERIEEYYLSKVKRENNNFSVWAKERFNPDILFNQFFKEL